MAGPLLSLLQQQRASHDVASWPTGRLDADPALRAAKKAGHAFTVIDGTLTRRLVTKRRIL
jgi:hypothetical protein